MTYIAKAESAVCAPKPTAYYEVSDAEVIFKDSEARSSNREANYHLSPGPAPKAADDTLLVGHKSEHSLTTSPTHSTTSPSAASLSSWESEGN